MQKCKNIIVQISPQIYQLSKKQVKIVKKIFKIKLPRIYAATNIKI